VSVSKLDSQESFHPQLNDEKTKNLHPISLSVELKKVLLLIPNNTEISSNKPL